MGENLVLHMEEKGFTVAVYNRTVSRVDHFIDGRGSGKNIIGTRSLEELPKTLVQPRKIILTVKAGEAVDALIEELLPLLDEGDVIIDGSNSYFEDTGRREERVKREGLLYVGTGVSGGEEGALKGPSIMPGGSSEAWGLVKPIFQSIAAKAQDGTPCCQWVGPGGAGHFAKMVHNGIEYGDMQLICETYHLMKEVLRFSPDEMKAVFVNWNEGDLKSYLIEITRDILFVQDEDGALILDKILDAGGQKGSGKLTVTSALDLGTPLTLTGESVFARYLSSAKEERSKASRLLAGPPVRFDGKKEASVDDLERALYASKIVSYAQGFALLKAASEKYGWALKCD